MDAEDLRTHSIKTIKFPRSGKDWTGGKNWTDIYFFPSLLTYGTAYESPEVGLSYASKIIAKLVLVAEL